MKWIKVLMSYCTWQQPKQKWLFETLQISRKLKTKTKAVLLSRKKLTTKFTVHGMKNRLMFSKTTM
jgi:hypothetical protein